VETDIPDVDCCLSKYDFKRSTFNLIGIIPLAGLQPPRFGSDLEPYLTPLAPDYTIIQNAMFMAAAVGCKSIWIACNEDVSPVLKRTLGNWTVDPFQLLPTGHLKQKHYNSWTEIPIYYTPIEAQYTNRRDCYAWSVISAASRAWRVHRRVSTWLTPEMYFVSFPYTVWAVDDLKKMRAKIKSKTLSLFSWQEKTVMDNEHIPFTFTSQNLYKASKIIKDAPLNRMSPDRTIAKKLTFKEVFPYLEKKWRDIRPLSWYYGLEDWDSYCTFIGSEHRKEMIIPPSTIFNHEPDLQLLKEK